MKLFLSAGLLVILAAAIFAGSNEQNVELGAVSWGRDLEAAKKKSAETGKPVLVLFQEVPG